MKVKALKNGFCDSRRKAGDVFDIDPRNFKGWMEKIEVAEVKKPKAAKVEPVRVAELL